MHWLQVSGVHKCSTCLLALSRMASLVLLKLGAQVVGEVSAELQMRKACRL